MNYIGSKYSLIKDISSLIEEHVPIRGKALDIFTGTSTVAQQLKLLGFETYANDWQYYSFVTAHSYLTLEEYPPFTKLIENRVVQEFLKQNHSPKNSVTRVHSLTTRRTVSQSSNAFEILRFLECIEGGEGHFYNQYCEGGTAQRLYYSKENGQKIQAIGDQISAWNQSGSLSETEQYWLRASLVESADRIANTASVYGAFLKKIKKSAQKPLKMIALSPILSPQKGLQHRAFCDDALSVFENHSLPQMTLTYIDPPYNHRQYSGNYHILETIARWDLDQFTPRGRTGLREASTQSSPFCSKVKALKSFEQLFSSINSTYLLFSYNNEGLLSEEELTALFNRHCSKVQFFKLQYGRFRADSNSEKRNYAADSVVEFLILGRRKER